MLEIIGVAEIAFFKLRPHQYLALLTRAMTHGAVGIVKFLPEGTNAHIHMAVSTFFIAKDLGSSTHSQVFMQVLHFNLHVERAETHIGIVGGKANLLGDKALFHGSIDVHGQLGRLTRFNAHRLPG